MKLVGAKEINTVKKASVKMVLVCIAMIHLQRQEIPAGTITMC